MEDDHDDQNDEMEALEAILESGVTRHGADYEPHPSW
jgi:uncharacterized protein YheU (UPF0270 family)